MCDIAVEGNYRFSDPMDSESLKDPLIKNQENPQTDGVNSGISRNSDEIRKSNGCGSGNNGLVRRERPSRACTQRAAQRMQQAAEAEAKMAAAEKKRRDAKRRERLARQLRDVDVVEEEEGEEREVEEGEGKAVGDWNEDGIDDVGKPSSSRGQCGKVVTRLVGEPESSQLPRWNIRAMWELASILNFLNVFRPLLNIKAEFSADEFETALISPNRTLGEIHMPLLKAIPPTTRMALGHNTWITVLCRKLRDWWHWVAEGELPIVAAQGAEIEAYHTLDPGVRVVILKALCDIRVEQEDIRSYIDDSIKQGFHPSTFRKERLGGDSHGISYWYEDDPIIGHRLYRGQRKVEVKRGKGRNIPPIPNSSYQWETVATNLDEFLDVSEKLFSSTNRTEVSVGKKLKNDMLAEIEKVHKRKEKLLKKQHRQALLLDNMIQMDALAAGRSLRDRKHVTYTFDDYDKSINEAIEETKKKPPSPDPTGQGDLTSHEIATNGTCPEPSQFSRQSSFGKQFSKSSTDDEQGYNSKDETIDHGNRRRQRPQRYSVKDFVEAVSDNDADYNSDEDIVGEAVYDDEYVRQRKRKKSSSSEEDEEYHWDDENLEDEEEEEEEEEASSYSSSDESDQPQPRKFMKLPGRTRRETKQRSVHEIQSGLRRSNRATRNRMDYSYYDMSDSENESMKPEKSNGSHEQSDASDNDDPSHSEDSDQNLDNQNIRVDQTMEEHSNLPKEEQEQDEREGHVQDNQDHPPEKRSSPDHNEVEGVRERQFLDLNELAPGSGYDDGPNSTKDEGTDDF